MKELEKTRQHIQRIGTIIYQASRVGIVILIILIILQAVLTAAVLASESVAGFVAPRLDNSFLFNVIKAVTDIEKIDTKDQAAIGCFVTLISYGMILVMLKMFTGVMKRLAAGERPFNAEVALKIRHGSFYLLFFLLYNPLLAVISFGLVMLVSFLMEYGSYLQDRADETNRIQEEIIMSFAEITENKSGQTGQHIKRVSEYSRILAEQLGLKPEEIEEVRIASTMHDVGKLLIPSEILEKPGKLTEEEYSTIKTHTTMGGKLLENVEGEEMKLSRTIALQHHERYDGKGYPDHLEGDGISLQGRIVAVADVYDALTSRRSYKNAWKEEDAYQEILKGRGTQFDPQVVDAFVEAHDKILEVREKYRDQEQP